MLRGTTDGLSKPSEPPSATHPSETAANGAATAAPPPSSGKYVPKFRRPNAEASAQTPPPEPDRWASRQDDRDRDRPSQLGDRWRSGGSGSRSTWSSSRRGAER